MCAGAHTSGQTSRGDAQPGPAAATRQMIRQELEKYWAWFQAKAPETELLLPTGAFSPLSHLPSQCGSFLAARNDNLSARSCCVCGATCTGKILGNPYSARLRYIGVCGACLSDEVGGSV